MFDPTLAEIRFGTGLSPKLSPPGSVRDLLDGVRVRDAMARRFPIEPYDVFRHRIRAHMDAQKAYRQNRGKPEEQELNEARKQLRRSANSAYGDFFRNAFLRRIHTETGFRERLSFFWQDHFTARGRLQVARNATGPYVEEAIRPNLSGRFEDLLIAAVTHPLMLSYLDQNQSVGPNSRLGKRSARRGNAKGLNENLAREVLELHTLGVDAQYSQYDVRELAELFTGLTFKRDLTFQFKAALAEPGAETVLGKSYGPGGGLREVKAVLRDLARHPATAKHLSKKLALHFISDQPDPALIASMEQAFLDSDGELLSVYSAMLSHPASWSPKSQKVKLPFDFMASALRALNVDEKTLKNTRTRDLRNILYVPMQIMGQPWEAPNGPDGWPEENNYWITPQFMAARLQWALAAPQALRQTLPDPRDFARAALGDRLPKDVAFAAGAAENRWEGIALVLTSPAFQKQ
ncbi:DUF1800 domain-containing protein [Cognatishimia activa]|uniref:DUF1800 domain-containing protein n=1 Tax=Cognatishimia activa TaxID=1715691 RepID=A0A0P1ISH8_9RHOB|nr:DUF1800 domain-containing protein [Cognatishimia activa]CUI66670.1 hypothetical protein TA5113_01092 [Cognatishimia activa]CUK26455.1 hypothetical protein TA5114_02265 [Cognatishimia activa]